MHKKLTMATTSNMETRNGGIPETQASQEAVAGGAEAPSGFILKLYQMVNGAPDEVITVSRFSLAFCVCEPLLETDKPATVTTTRHLSFTVPLISSLRQNASFNGFYANCRQSSLGRVLWEASPAFRPPNLRFFET